MEEGALNREMKDEELARVPSEERVSFQAKSRGVTRKNGAVRSHKQLPMAGVGVPGGEFQGAAERGWGQFIRHHCALLRILNFIMWRNVSQTSLMISITWLTLAKNLDAPHSLQN